MRKGFTLSEVLITLGIVGVIAALTVPAIMKNYKNKVYTAQLKKTYSQLSDATKAIMNDEMSNSFYETTAGVPSDCTDNDEKKPKGACYFLNNYFKVAKRNCNVLASEASVKTLCVSVGSNGKPNDADAYKTISGANAGPLSGEYCIQTTNGAAICQRYRAATDDTVAKTTFNIDVNGPAQPNISGRDVFWLEVKDDGSIIDFENTDPAKCSNPSSAGCLNKIIQAGWRMDY